MLTITANFRAYNNWGESIADHSKLILNGTRDKSTRYHGVLGADYICYAIHKGGYATDPGYPDKIAPLSIFKVCIKKNNKLFSTKHSKFQKSEYKYYVKIYMKTFSKTRMLGAISR
ncbi:hypothetical protein EEL31_15375 [Brevibacillus laterosporus]|nr:hypothetical protein EEL31_15375 [Brevibacillus laterosporus]